MSNPDELLADTTEALAVETPWHRTIYVQSGSSDAKSGPLESLARQLSAIALGIQAKAINSSIQAIAGGVKTVSDTAGNAAEKVSKDVPGAALVADMAQRMAGHVTRVAARSDNVSASPSATEMGNLIFGPMAAIASLPLAAATEATTVLADTAPGRKLRNALAMGINTALDALSVTPAETTLDTFRMRETWMAMTTGPGKSALADIVNMSTGFARVFMGDTRSLANALETGIINMNYGWQYGKHGYAYPQVPIGGILSQIAGLLVQRQPATLIEALGTNHLWKVGNASLEDIDNAIAMAGLYPAGLGLVAMSIGRFLTMGLRDCNVVESYIRAESELISQYPELRDEAELARLSQLSEEDALRNPAVKALSEFWQRRPFTCTEFEFYVGCAKSKTSPDQVARGLLNHAHMPVGVFPQELIDLAQDTAFWYSCTLLGREEGLKRVLRLYGAGVRDRLGADPTLETNAGLDAARAQALAAATKGNPEAQAKLRQLADERAASLGRLQANPDTYMPENARQRLNFFVELQQAMAAVTAS